MLQLFQTMIFPNGISLHQMAERPSRQPAIMFEGSGPYLILVHEAANWSTFRNVVFLKT